MYVLSIVICPFVLFLLAIVLSGLLQYTVSDYLPLVSSNSSCAYLTTFAFLMPDEQFRLPRASKLKYRHTFVFITLHPLSLKKIPLLQYLCPPLWNSYLTFHCKVIKPLQRYLYPSPCIKIDPLICKVLKLFPQYSLTPVWNSLQIKHIKLKIE